MISWLGWLRIGALLMSLLGGVLLAGCRIKPSPPSCFPCTDEPDSPTCCEEEPRGYLMVPMVLIAALPATVAVTLLSLGLLVYFAIRASDESRRAQLSTF